MFFLRGFDYPPPPKKKKKKKQKAAFDPGAIHTNISRKLKLVAGLRKKDRSLAERGSSHGNGLQGYTYRVSGEGIIPTLNMKRGIFHRRWYEKNPGLWRH